MYKLVIRDEDNEIVHEEDYDGSCYNYSKEAATICRFADEAGAPLDVQIMDMENNEIVYSSVMSDAGLNR